MYSDEECEENAVLVTKLYSAKAQACAGAAKPRPPPGLKALKAPVLTCTQYDASRRRLYYGLDNGDLNFWVLDAAGAGSSRYVGSHAGPITCICTPQPDDGALGKAGLLLSGSVDANIRIWDYQVRQGLGFPPMHAAWVHRTAMHMPIHGPGVYSALMRSALNTLFRPPFPLPRAQGRVVQAPTVAVQTLYGHASTITALHVYGNHVLSASTDKSIRAWRRVDGRQHLAYPWFELQVRCGWVGGGGGRTGGGTGPSQRMHSCLSACLPAGLPLTAPASRPFEAPPEHCLWALRWCWLIICAASGPP